jgi:hypothetical protein
VVASAEGPHHLASQSQPQYLSEPIRPDEDLQQQLAAPNQPRLPPGTRNGIFQKLKVMGTWIAQPEEGDLGFTDLETSIVLGFPFPVRTAPLLVTPRFGVHYLQGPATPDLPARLYDSAIEFRHMRQLNDRWAMDVAVTTGYYSDHQRDNGDAFRVTGRGLAVYEWSPFTKVVLGVVYLNRAGASVIPAAGLIVKPSDSVRWELIFPRPRAALRLDSWSTPDIDEWWCYVVGEFGGGVWTIERASGARDVITSRDYRAILGLERKITDGIDQRFEVGYVFEREIEFDSGTPDFYPGDTVMLRLGLVY